MPNRVSYNMKFTISICRMGISAPTRCSVATDSAGHDHAIEKEDSTLSSRLAPVWTVKPIKEQVTRRMIGKQQWHLTPLGLDVPTPRRALLALSI
jgi:hypothetical protein